jgi:hypothetical protein
LEGKKNVFPHSSPLPPDPDDPCPGPVTPHFFIDTMARLAAQGKRISDTSGQTPEDIILYFIVGSAPQRNQRYAIENTSPFQGHFFRLLGGMMIGVFVFMACLMWFL